MPTTRKQRSRTSTPSKKAVTQEQAFRALDRPAPVNVPLPEAAAPPARPRHLVSAYLMGASLCYRVFISPMWQYMHTAGMMGRPAYPVNYSPAPVVCSLEQADVQIMGSVPQYCAHQVLLQDAGVAILSCDAHRGDWNAALGPLRDASGRGQLWAYDYVKQSSSKPIELAGFPQGQDFHPLGMDTYTNAFKTSLFVVNQQQAGPSVEVFTIDPARPTRAKYERTISTHKELASANDVAAMSHASVYVSNDHAWTRQTGGDYKHTIETFATPIFGRGWLAHIDLAQDEAIVTRAYQGLRNPTGLAIGLNDTIYMASSHGSVHVFQPANSSTPLLVQNEAIPFGYSLDKLSVAVEMKDGLKSDVLVVGGHPNFNALRQLAASPQNTRAETHSPSWLTRASRRTALEIENHKDVQKRVGEANKRYEPTHSKEWDLQTLFQDDGRFFGSSTGASLDAKRGLLVGTGLYETGLLRCSGLEM